MALITAIAMFTGNVALIGIGQANANLARDSRLRAALVASTAFVFAALFGGLAVVVAVLINAFPSLSWSAMPRHGRGPRAPGRSDPSPCRRILQLLLQAGTRSG